MKFKEFKERILKMDEYMPHGLNDKDVVVVTNDGGIGGRSCTKVQSVSHGFDWEANRINIVVKDRIHIERTKNE